mgnify:CR=1 FL=1
MTYKTIPQVTRERFTTTLNGDLLQKIKVLAIHRKSSVNTLLEEAMADLLVKYDVIKTNSKKKRNENQHSLFEDE